MNLSGQSLPSAGKFNSSGECREIKVGMGDLQVATGPVVFRTLLGSCVGLALHDPHRAIGGLAHVVLPNSGGTAALPGKYADTALPELLRQLVSQGARRTSLTARIAGAANMFATTRANPIGEQNIAAVESLLREANIPLIGSHCGGTQGRRMTFFLESGKILIDVVGSITTEI
ncbi:MAG: chemotaxis protein CheD [Planctomycetales bacterium]